MNIKAFLNTISSNARTLPIVIIYITEGCNLKCVTCSYRLPLPGELNFEEITGLAGTLAEFGLKHIVYSGGEPLLRRDFPEICKVFAGYGVKQTLLTNGLLLEKRIDDIKQYFTEIIVSMDGANPDTHNKIRGVNSFELILKGIAKTLTGENKPVLSIRTVLQKLNFRELEGLIELAKHTGIRRISFLAADVSSDAYGRDTRGAVEDESRIALNDAEIIELRDIIDYLAVKYEKEFASGLISESPEKLHHIADYYDALISGGSMPFPKNLCNAPMVSAVITSTGDIHPCFFLPSFGNIRNSSFSELINTPSIIDTRKQVKKMEPVRCKECVCTLYTSPKNALLDGF
jgi:MoaA/NifB/PqqE/SkfB family radical SAM enzyme